MRGSGGYTLLVCLEFVLAVLTFVGLQFVTAPYGRHGRAGWGPTVPARLGWLVMEAPAPVVFALVYLAGPNRAAPVPLVLLALWELHYVQRAFVYPFLMRSGARMPLSVMAMAIAFNLLNASINAHWVSAVGEYPVSWLTDPRFVVGALVFLAGLAVNLSADRTLRVLRGNGAGYQIPRG